MTIYTDKHTGKKYQLGAGFYSRTVTQFPVGARVHFDGSASAPATARVTFPTQAARAAWLRMMGFTK